MSEEVIIERIDNLKEFLKLEFKENQADRENIKKTMRQYYDDHELRIRKIEDWKLMFVAKFSVYSAIALMAGSLMATILLNFIGKYI
jgi:hypothetical protein